MSKMTSASFNYHIIKLCINDVETIEIVPKSWIAAYAGEPKQPSELWWPNVEGRTLQRMIYLKKEIEDKSGRTYKISHAYTTADNYEEAEEIVEEMMIASSSHAKETANTIDQRPASLNESVEKRNPRILNDTKISIENLDEIPEEKRFQYLAPYLSGLNREQQKVSSKLDKITNGTVENGQLILQRVHPINRALNGEELMSVRRRLPFERKEAFLAYNVELATDSTKAMLFRQYLLNSVVGQYGFVTKEILKKLMTPNVAVHYNVDGINREPKNKQDPPSPKKDGFIKLYIYQIIMEVIMQLCADANENAVKLVMGNWLKGAKKKLITAQKQAAKKK